MIIHQVYRNSVAIAQVVANGKENSKLSKYLHSSTTEHVTEDYLLPRNLCSV